MNTRQSKKNISVQQPLEHGKLPPQAIEAEEAIIGALMSEKEAIIAVVNILVADNFYREAHQRIYTAITSLYAIGEPIDLITVARKLRTSGEIEFVGGMPYLASLTNKVNSAANIEYHARIVQSVAIKREMIKYAGQILQEGFEDSTDSLDLLDKSTETLSVICQSIFKGAIKTNASVIKTLVESLGNKKEDSRLSTGFGFLDKYIKLRRGEGQLIYVGARPSVGKSALVAAITKNIAQEGTPVGCITLEMSADAVVKRMVVSELKDEYTNSSFVLEDVPIDKIVKVQNAMSKVQDLPIYYLDSEFELSAILNTIKLWYAKYGVGLIVLDFIQQIEVAGYKDDTKRIAIASRSIQKLMKKLQIPFIVISSLNRNAERNDGKPTLADFKACGDIESDADVALLLWRPETGDCNRVEMFIDGSNQSLDPKGLMLGDFAKNRNGITGVTAWRHHLPSNNFYPLDYQESFSNSFPVNPGHRPFPSVPNDFEGKKDYAF